MVLWCGNLLNAMKRGKSCKLGEIGELSEFDPWPRGTAVLLQLTDDQTSVKLIDYVSRQPWVENWRGNRLPSAPEVCHWRSSYYRSQLQNGSSWAIFSESLKSIDIYCGRRTQTWGARARFLFLCVCVCVGGGGGRVGGTGIFIPIRQKVRGEGSPRLPCPGTFYATGFLSYAGGFLSYAAHFSPTLADFLFYMLHISLLRWRISLPTLGGGAGWLSW